ncbi:putative transcription factor GAGA-Binding-like family [Lupinus albus]|uniref:GAGA-binding transcriptional activator n=1 Tax=Lupinus albus TaxID=3870 RepID=A0A6A4PP96_LUPAL|nr:putative transcription factor GAGA-Binding-like family [Lupinus albus]
MHFHKYPILYFTFIFSLIFLSPKEPNPKVLYPPPILMDDDVLNMSNWGYYEPFKGGHLGLHLMTDPDTKPFFPGRDPSMFVGASDRDSKPFLSGHDPSMFISVNDRDSKPFLSGRDPSMFVGVNDRDVKPLLPGRDPSMFIGANGTMHPRDCVVSEAPMSMNYVRDGWISLRDRFFNMPPVTPDNAVLPESSAPSTMQTTQLPDTSRNEKVDSIEDSVVKKVGQSKKRQSTGVLTSPKAKKLRKPKDNSDASVQHVKPIKKTKELLINGIDMDISGLPIPVCSCTGTPQQCYRWGCGGWQSACCTTNVSIYPLPMNVKRRGARIAGRKMSQGAFKKVLEKLAAEGYNFVNPIDLRTHWARHGTNKFVTIR